MTATVKLAGSTVATSSWLARGFGEAGPSMAQAADGTGSFGGIKFENPGGTLDVRGFMTVTIDETDCSAPRLFTGYVFDRNYGRGTFTTGADGVVDTNLVDQNYVLNHRLITGVDGKRPAETDQDRLDWLLGSSYLSGLIADYGLVNVGTPANLDEADYRRQYPAQVLADIATQRRTLFFAYYDQTNAAVGLFYDLPTATTFDSTLSISNVPADVNETTCFVPYQDSTLRRTPENVYSLVDLQWTGGETIRTSTATLAEFFTDNDLGHRGVAIENSRIGRSATAITHADTELVHDSDEQDILTLTVELPSTKVGLIQAGMRIGVRMSHWPGYSTQQMVRIERLEIKQAERKPKLYEVTLTCSNRGNVGAGGGAPGPGGFPLPPSTVGPCGAEATYLSIESNSSCSAQSIHITAGQYVYLLRITTDITFLGTSEWSLFLDTNTAAGIAEGGSATPDNTTTPMILRIASGYPGTPHKYGTWTSPNMAGDSTMLVSFVYPVQEGHGVFRGGPTTWEYSYFVCATTGDYHLRGGNFVGDGYFHNIGYTANVCVIASDLPPASFISPSLDSDPVPPTPGQWVYNELVTLTAGSGTTAFPFADGSLHVRYDIIDQTPAIVSYDGTTGDFTMPSQPPLGTQVFVDYQGR